MANKDQYFSENTYILGDKAYPLLCWCLTSYINRGNLTPSQIYFNELQSSTRQQIERTFCLKKIEIFRYEPYRPDSKDSVSLLYFTQHMPQLSWS